MMFFFGVPFIRAQSWGEWVGWAGGWVELTSSVLSRLVFSCAKMAARKNPDDGAMRNFFDAWGFWQKSDDQEMEAVSVCNCLKVHQHTRQRCHKVFLRHLGILLGDFVCHQAMASSRFGFQVSIACFLGQLFAEEARKMKTELEQMLEFSRQQRETHAARVSLRSSIHLHFGIKQRVTDLVVHIHPVGVVRCTPRKSSGTVWAQTGLQLFSAWSGHWTGGSGHWCSMICERQISGGKRCEGGRRSEGGGMHGDGHEGGGTCPE